MKYYITLYIPSTNYQEISPLSIDEIQSMRKEEEEYELILEDISNILGINIYANTLLLSNSFRDSTAITKEDEEYIFSQIALDLRNLIEYIVSKKDFFHTLFDNEILKNIKRIKTVQTDAEINSKRLGRLSYFLGGITIVSFIIMVLQVMHIIK